MLTLQHQKLIKYLDDSVRKQKYGTVTITDKIIHSGDTNTAIRFPSNDTVTIETNGLERMRINSSGNIGIGTIATSSLVHIRGTGNILRLETLGSEDQDGVTLRFEQSDTTIIENQGYGGIEWQGNDTGNTGVRGFIKGFSEGTAGQFGLRFAVQGSGASNPAEAMRIINTGNIAIGANTAVARLDVSGTVRATDFNSVSDIALKQDIQLIENSLDKLHKINGYTFTYKNTNKKGAGVLAQEIEAILPQAVSGEEGSKSVAYGNLTGLLIEAIKDLSAKIDVLEATKHTKL
jgi:hypothetical protein